MEVLDLVVEETFGIDQIADISKIGSEYIFVKAAGANSFENVLIVAHENNTEVYASGLLQVTLSKQVNITLSKVTFFKMTIFMSILQKMFLPIKELVAHRARPIKASFSYPL